MKAVHIFILLIGLCLSLGGTVFTSTATGGVWNAPSTWINNAVPSASDDVVINGIVYVHTGLFIHHATVGENGVLINQDGLNSWLTVTGNFINYGAVTNSSSGGAFDLMLKGNLSHYGVISNRFVYLDNSSAVMNIFQAEQAAAFNCAQFNAQGTSMGARMLSDLRFLDVAIDLNGKELQMYNGPNSYNLTVQGGRLYRASLNTQGFSTLSMGYGSYLYNVTGEDIIITGPALIYQGVSFQNLTVTYEGSINAWTGGTYDLTINQDLVCYGIIAIEPTGNIYLRLYGDLYNYGIIATYYVYFMGTGTQQLYHDPSAAPFLNNTLGKPSSVTSGQVVLLSDLRAMDTMIDMNGRNLICHSSGTPRSISLVGGFIYRCNLITSGFSTLMMDGGAYLYNVTAGDFILQGTVMVYYGVSFDDVVNQGTLQSWYGINNLSINGDLHNWAQISENAGSNLYLHLKKDIFNRGNTSCAQIHFDGPANQTLQLVQGYNFGAQNIFLISNWGNAQFWLYDVLVYQGNTYYDIDTATPGIWTIVAGTQQRTVSILPATGSPLPQPQITDISIQDEFVTVTWNEVPGAYYYLLQEASDPYVVFSDYYYVWDDQPGDGVVSYHAPVVLPRRFYKVIALD